MFRKRWIPVAFAGLALAGCSAGSGGLQSEYQSMSDLLAGLSASGVACDPYVKATGEKIATREHGDCTWQGHVLTITLLTGDASQSQQIFDVFKPMMSGYPLHGGNFLVQVEDEATAKELSGKLGLPFL